MDNKFNNQLIINEFFEALLNIDRNKAENIFEKLYSSEDDFEKIENIICKSLELIGDGWEDGTYSLAQVYMSGSICENLIDKYLPKTSQKRKILPKIGIGVLRDNHELGKRIVYSMVRSAGYEIIDLGVGLSANELANSAINNNIEVLLISTLMYPSAKQVINVKKIIEEKGLSIKIVVGGAPFRMDKNLWKQIRADAFGYNASDIIEILREVSK